MIRLHRWLLDSSNPHGGGLKIGKLIVGVSTCIFVIALISGVVIWWPRVRTGLRRSLTITTKNGWRFFWKSLHVAGGMYALVIVLVMALTGLTWSFDWYRSAFYAVCGVEYAPRHNNGRNAKNSRDSHNAHGIKRERIDDGKEDIETWRQHSEFGHWQQFYDELKIQNPDAPQITIGIEKATVKLGSMGNGRASDSYVYKNRTEAISPSAKYADSDPADKLRGWIYSIHTGSFGGMTTRIMWFFASILGASLPITGYYMWIRRLKKRNH